MVSGWKVHRGHLHRFPETDAFRPRLRSLDRAREYDDRIPQLVTRRPYLYFDTTLNADPAFFRIRISDRKLDRLVSLKGVRRFRAELGGQWTGLAPYDSLLRVRDTSSQEVYALDFQAP
jgi:hypothetical protein